MSRQEELEQEISRLTRIIQEISDTKYIVMSPDGLIRSQETPLDMEDQKNGWCYVYVAQL